MKTVLNHSPRRGRRIIAQDKRSAVLGKADKWSQSPVGATEITAKILKGIADVFDRADKANKITSALAPAKAYSSNPLESAPLPAACPASRNTHPRRGSSPPLGPQSLQESQKKINILPIYRVYPGVNRMPAFCTVSDSLCVPFPLRVRPFADLTKLTWIPKMPQENELYKIHPPPTTSSPS